jgi:transcriptional regulator with XRE-family HTH domain
MNELATKSLHRTFCNNIKARRIALGLTQKEVADRMGVAQATYAECESGRHAPGLPQIERICEALYVTPAYALSDRSNPSGAQVEDNWQSVATNHTFISQGEAAAVLEHAANALQTQLEVVRSMSERLHQDSNVVSGLPPETPWPEPPV